MQPKSKNILIISSHADDHLSCAGTVFKLQKERGMVPFEIVLTDSGRGQDFRVAEHQSYQRVRQLRLKELSVASKFLGIKEIFLFGQPDFGLQSTVDLVFATAKIIRQVRPEIVFMQSEGDVHPDHRASFRIGVDALKLAAFDMEAKTLGPSFRVPVVLCVDQELPGRIHLLVDISKYQDKKEKLMKVYESQMSPKALAFQRGLLSVRGYHLSNSHLLAAEGFSLSSEFPILGFDPVASLP